MRVSEDGEDGAVDDSNDESWLCLTANPSYAAACFALPCLVLQRNSLLSTVAKFEKKGESVKRNPLKKLI